MLVAAWIVPLVTVIPLVSDCQATAGTAIASPRVSMARN